jgi:hypothetical protein
MVNGVLEVFSVEVSTVAMVSGGLDCQEKNCQNDWANEALPSAALAPWTAIRKKLLIKAITTTNRKKVKTDVVDFGNCFINSPSGIGKTVIKDFKVIWQSRFSNTKRPGCSLPG